MKHLQQLLSLIHHGIAADELYLQGFLAQVNGIETSEEMRDFIRENQERNQPFLAHLSEEGMLSYGPVDPDKVPEGSVLVVQLRGPVMPKGQYGIPGLEDLSALLTGARFDDRIAGAVMVLETGGGSVYRLQEFCDLMDEVRQAKPILTLADGITASAGVEMGVGANEFYATHRSAKIGSIGVMISYMDMIPWFEKQGCKYHMVVAKTAPDKNKDLRELRAGLYDNLEESLAEAHGEFKAHIKKYRSEVPEEAMTGKVYSATKAQELNLIDGIATLEQVISRTYELSISQLIPQNT